MVKTTSGATAVQIVHSSRQRSRDIEHLGSAQAQMQTLDNSCQILAADNSGQNELASCPAFGRIDNGTVIPLPGNAGIESAAW